MEGGTPDMTTGRADADQARARPLHRSLRGQPFTLGGLGRFTGGESVAPEVVAAPAGFVRAHLLRRRRLR